LFSGEWLMTVCGRYRRPPRRRSRQLGDDLHEFRLGPGAAGAGMNIAERSKRQREFSDVVAVRRFDEDHEIAVAGGEIQLLDSMPIFLASSRAAWVRFGASLIVRIPWSVNLSDSMKVGIMVPADFLDVTRLRLCTGYFRRQDGDRGE